MGTVQESKVVVYEGNDALVAWILRLKTTAGHLVAFPYEAGDTFEFYAKYQRGDADGDAFAQYTQAAGDITVDETDGTLVSVQMASADLTTAGSYRYHLDVLKGGTNRETVAYGAFLIEDL